MYECTYSDGIAVVAHDMNVRTSNSFPKYDTKSEFSATRLRIYDILTLSNILFFSFCLPDFVYFLIFFALSASSSSSGCIMLLTPVQNLMMGVVIPIIFWALLLGLMGIHAAIQQVMHMKQIGVGWSTSSSPCRRMMALALPNPRVAFKSSPYIRTFVALLLSSYNSISQTTLASLNCEDKAKKIKK